MADGCDAQIKAAAILGDRGGAGLSDPGERPAGDGERMRIGAEVRIARDFQHFRKPGAGPVDAALDRADRATADHGRLLVGKA